MRRAGLCLSVILSLPGGGQAVENDRVLSGVVEDTSGGAIAGAAITVHCGPVVWTGASSATGTFEARQLPAEVCEVRASSELFATTTVQTDLRQRTSAFVRLVLPIAGLSSEVVVTPARGEREASFRVPESIAVTTREELEARPHQILPQVLREEPGVLVQQTTTGQGSPFIRGFSAQRIVYLIDGVRLNTSTFRAGATQYLGWVDSSLVERLEVVRGPASVQYGSDALGGTINVLSLKPALAPQGRAVEGQVEATLGSADLSGGVHGEVTVRTPGLAIRAGGGGRRIDDLRTGRGRDSHAAVTRFLGLPSSVVGNRLERTGYSQGGGHVAATIRLGEASSLNALYLHEEQANVRRYDRLLGGDGLTRSEFDPQRFDFATLRYVRATAGPVDGLTVAFSMNRQQDDRLEQIRPEAVVDRDQGRVLAFGYQAQAIRRLGARSTLTFGGELYDEYVATRRSLETPSTGSLDAVRPEIPDGTRYVSAGLFTQSVTDLTSRLSLRGGLRYGHFTFRTRSQPAFGVDDERVTTGAVTFHTGGVVRIAPVLNGTFTVSRGFRAANAFDLGAIGITGGGFEIAPQRAAALGGRIGTTDGATAVSTGAGLERLTPESLYGFEAGLKLQTARTAAAISVFDLELVDAIARRTAIFPVPVVGTVVAGYTIVRQDEAGRAFVAEDPRPIVTRANVDRARIAGLEADAQVRLRPAWLLGAFFSFARGHELGTGTFLRRMPPPLGGANLKWEPTDRAFWVEGTVGFALRQTRLSPGDLSDARIGGRRTLETIARFFEGGAVDLGLVRNGRLTATGETLDDVRTRVLGGEAAAPLFESTPGFLVVGLRGGWRFGPRVDLTLMAENVTDRNYRLHGSGVDAPGVNVQTRIRYRF